MLSKSTSFGDSSPITEIKRDWLVEFHIRYKIEDSLGNLIGAHISCKWDYDVSLETCYLLVELGLLRKEQLDNLGQKEKSLFYKQGGKLKSLTEILLSTGSIVHEKFNEVIDTRFDYGRHIPIKCGECGAMYSTKNISHIGARSIFDRGPSCECDFKKLRVLTDAEFQEHAKTNQEGLSHMDKKFHPMEILVKALCKQVDAPYDKIMQKFPKYEDARQFVIRGVLQEQNIDVRLGFWSYDLVDTWIESDNLLNPLKEQLNERAIDIQDIDVVVSGEAGEIIDCNFTVPANNTLAFLEFKGEKPKLFVCTKPSYGSDKLYLVNREGVIYYINTPKGLCFEA